jgi:hypothetical protein
MYENMRFENQKFKTSEVEKEKENKENKPKGFVKIDEIAIKTREAIKGSRDQ